MSPGSSRHAPSSSTRCAPSPDDLAAAKTKLRAQYGDATSAAPPAEGPQATTTTTPTTTGPPPPEAPEPSFEEEGRQVGREYAGPVGEAVMGRLVAPVAQG